MVPENLFRYNFIKFLHQSCNLWKFLAHLMTFGAHRNIILLLMGTRNSKFWLGVKIGRKKTFIVFCGQIGSVYESRGTFSSILAKIIFLNF